MAGTIKLISFVTIRKLGQYSRTVPEAIADGMTGPMNVQWELFGFQVVPGLTLIGSG
jgi:hypothetical protein